MNTELVNTKHSVILGSVVSGFSGTLVMGTAWVITHVPWMGLDQQVAIPIILLCWLITLAAWACRVGKSQSLRVGIGSGLVSGLTGLVFFGTRLGANSDASSSEIVPNAPLLVLGFVALSLTIGLIAGAMGRVVGGERASDRSDQFWLSRFAIVAVCATLPLIFIGGLVTSTNSGMAVPDWPQSYGANMFLYRLGSHSDPGTYVEHAHRLFGSFLGLTMLVLVAWVWISDRRRAVRWAVRWLVTVAFLFVCCQGILGGLRVYLQTHYTPTDPMQGERIGRLFALVHGIFGQITVGLVATLPVALSMTFRALTPGQRLLDPALARRIKFLCTLTLHALILQLLLGAWYRHYHSKHVLYTHIVFSIFVLIAATITGFTLSAEKARQNIVGPITARLGLALAIVACVQFLLGWVAFGVAGLHPDTASIPQAITRTIHQANGGILIALAAACYVWGRRLGRAALSTSPTSPATA